MAPHIRTNRIDEVRIGDLILLPDHEVIDVDYHGRSGRVQGHPAYQVAGFRCGDERDICITSAGHNKVTLVLRPSELATA